MITLNVEGMHCNGCVSRVTEALKNVGIAATVSLENGTVAFEGTEDQKQQAVEEIQDLGFDVV